MIRGLREIIVTESNRLANGESRKLVVTRLSNSKINRFSQSVAQSSPSYRPAPVKQDQTRATQNTVRAPSHRPGNPNICLPTSASATTLHKSNSPKSLPLTK